MKINVNYELMEKIGEAKTGFNLNKAGRKFLVEWGFVNTVAYSIAHPADYKEFLSNSLYALVFLGTQIFGYEFLYSPVCKRKAIERLSELASLLINMNVSTNDELLLEAREYKTEYKIHFSKRHIPMLQQNKYIMVPTHKEGEISLLQEHVIGTRSYDLSVGKPQKKMQLRMAFNGV